MRKEFDIKYRPQIESGEYKVETRDGRPARIVCYNRKFGNQLIALATEADGRESYISCKSDGRVNTICECSSDLFIVTPEQSEDERIMKELIDYFRDPSETKVTPADKFKEWHAWLVGQKEYIEDIRQYAYNKGLVDAEEKQKPAESDAIKGGDFISDGKRVFLVLANVKERNLGETGSTFCEGLTLGVDGVVYCNADDFKKFKRATSDERAKFIHDLKVRVELKKQPTEWDYSYGKNETVDNLIGIAECLEMDADCSFNGMNGLDCGKFLRKLAMKESIKPAEWSEEYREEDLRTRFAFYTYKDEDDVLYLSNVFVKETSRNKGFGTKILQAAEKVAETIGATTIRLKVKHDSPANVWYRKNGYGYMTFEDGYDWLEKNLEYMKPTKPELSKDERIRKGLIEHYSEFNPEDKWDVDISFKEIVSYLEKQKDTSVPCSEDLSEEIDRISKRYPEVSFAKLSRIAVHFANWQQAKMPASWSEEDRRKIVKLKTFIAQCNGFNKENRKKAFDMINALRPQPITYTLDAPLGYDKDQNPIYPPINHWKPSKEQMDALEASYSVLKTHDTWGEDEHLPLLASLYDDLKKL